MYDIQFNQGGISKQYYVASICMLKNCLCIQKVHCDCRVGKGIPKFRNEFPIRNHKYKIED